MMVEVEPLLWASFVPSIYPNGDRSKRPLADVYCELVRSIFLLIKNDLENLKRVCNESLAEFNLLFTSSRMELVLFMNAIEHILRIVRVLQTPLGHALLVGVGGSGRK